MDRDSFVRLGNISANRRAEREEIAQQAAERKAEQERKRERRNDILDGVGFFCALFGGSAFIMFVSALL